MRVPEAPALPLLRARRGTGRGRQRAAEMWILSRTVAKTGAVLTKNYGYMAMTGEEDEGSGESQETRSERDGNGN